MLKPRKPNVGLDHFSHILTGEDVGNLDDNFKNLHLFVVEMIDD